MKSIILSFFIAFNSYALTENDVVQSVLQHFPLIEEASMKVESSKGELTSAEGAFDFKLNFKSRNRIEDEFDNQYFESSIERQTGLGGLGLIAGHRQGRGTFAPYDGKYKTSGAGEIFGGITLPLLRNFRTDENRTNIKIKNLELDQTKEQLRLKKLMYVHKALSLYYKWILEAQKLKINKSMLQLSVDRNKMITSRFKAGDLEKIKITDNNRSMDKRESEVIKNQISLSQVQAELSLFVRNPDGSPRLLADIEASELDLKKPEVFENIDSTISIPQVEILNIERKKIQAELSLFENSRLPGLSVDLLGAKELSPNAAFDPESFQIGIKFDFPIENRKAEGKTVAVAYKLQAIDKQKMYIEQQLKQQQDFFLTAGKKSFDRWEVTSREFESTVKLADAEKSKWIQGASDLYIVNLREQDVADVDIRRWTSLYEYHQYILDAKLFTASLPIEIKK